MSDVEIPGADSIPFEESGDDKPNNGLALCPEHQSEVRGTEERQAEVGARDAGRWEG